MAEQGQFFDKIAQDYRNIHTKNIRTISGTDSDYFSMYKFEEISRQVKDPFAKLKILDFGCGDGIGAVYAKMFFPNSSYFGIDVSKNSITIAKQRGLDSTNFQVYDGEKIPFIDGTFDIVFIACVFHHIDSIKHIACLKEINRVLTKCGDGGGVFLFEHNPWNPLTRKVVHDCPFDEGVTLIPSTKMKKLSKAAFGDSAYLKIRYTIFFPRKGIFKKFLPLEQKLSWCPLGGQYYMEYRKEI